MTWQEQRIRDAMSSMNPVPSGSTQFLLDEVDRMRKVLASIRDQAHEHVEDREPGWGRWQTTRRLAREGLGELYESDGYEGGLK